LIQPSDAFIKIGSVLRPHGLSGELVIKPVIQNPEKLHSHKIFYVKNERGDFIPWRVEDSRLVFKSNQNLFFVKFVQVTNRDASEAAKGLDVYLLKEEFEVEPPPDEADYIDYELISEDGEQYGFVVDVMENPAHMILEVIGDHGKILVPMVDAYIISKDDEKKQLVGKDIQELMQI